MTKIYKIALYAIALICVLAIGKTIKTISFDSDNKIPSLLKQEITPAKIENPYTSYKDVKLKTSINEILYELGTPTAVATTFIIEESKNNNHKDSFYFVASNEEISKNPKGYKGFDVWIYRTGILQTLIEFDKEGNVESIACSATEDNLNPFEWQELLKGCEIAGIDLFTTEENAKRIVGKPTDEWIDGNTKKLEYKNFNLRMHLRKKETVKIEVFLPTE